MSPSRKIRKIDEGGMKKTQPDGIFRFEVDVSELEDGPSYQSVFEVRGVPWRARAFKHGHLSFFFHCNPNQSTLWRIDVDTEFILIHADSNKNVYTEESYTFDSEHTCNVHNSLKWNQVVDEERGFVIGGKITMKIRFWISSFMGIISVPRIDFTDPDEPSHDIALVIEGVKIYVSKQILAVNSPVFKAMFYGKFVEKNMKEIELEDVDRKEFIEMLNVIYPSCNKITEFTAEFLLKLGDRFEIVRLIERVEEFLMKPCSMSKMDVLKIADQYRLFGLKEHCLSALKTTQDFKAVRESPIYNGLSDATKILLLEKHLDMS